MVPYPSLQQLSHAVASNTGWSLRQRKNQRFGRPSRPHNTPSPNPLPPHLQTPSKSPHFPALFSSSTPNLFSHIPPQKPARAIPPTYHSCPSKSPLDAGVFTPRSRA